MLSVLLTLCLTPTHPMAASAPLPAEDPPTAAEASGWTRTSTHHEVGEFLGRLGALSHGDRIRVSSAGTSTGGRDLLLVTVGSPPPEAPESALCGERLRILINGNIHGGEVEGKEALQQLLRSFAQGEHSDLLEKVVLFIVPVYNADGNDAIAPTNRVSQNGPDGGVGERANGQGLDLNRDFLKAESPECRALLSLMNSIDPHLFVDLHTTNGSDHAYHLTYSPSLSTNVDPAIDSLAREDLLPKVAQAMAERAGWRLFHYGNFSGRDQSQWTSYDHRGRYGTNYVGLRNRFSVLSEAFSYLPFKERVEVTHDFVFELIRYAAANADPMREACAAADARVLNGEFAFGVDSTLDEGAPGEVLRGSLTKVELPGLGTRRVVGQEWTPQTMQVRVSFSSARRVELPEAWILPDPPAPVLELLIQHGLDLQRLDEASTVMVRAFVPTEVKHAKRLFEGHYETQLVGEWHEQQRDLPAGTLVVPARQRLARLAAQLLEPESEDGLVTWNFLDGAIRATEGDVPGTFPVLRLPASSGNLAPSSIW